MMEISLLLLALIPGLALVAFYAYFNSAYSYWKKRGVKTIKPIPPFGNFARTIFVSSPGFHVAELYHELEGEKFAGLYAFSIPKLLLRDPQLIKEVLIKKFDRFHSRGILPNEEVEPLEGHLFNLAGREWRHLRIRLSSIFTSGRLKMMFPTMVEAGKQLQEYLKTPAERKGVIEFKDVLARFSTDIIGSCAFGIKYNCLKDPKAEARAWGKSIFDTHLKGRILGYANILVPTIAKRFNINMMSPYASINVRKLVKETIEYREANSIHRNDFMQLMIHLKNKTLGFDENDPLLKMPTEQVNGLKSTAPFEVTMDVIGAQAFVFFAAGFETSSTTMSFCLYELARNPDIQDRLRKEIDAVLKKHDGQITYEAVLEMEYLDKVVKETLRKYPTFPLLTRECAETTKLEGADLVIEKGIQIMLPVFGLHHDPYYYPEPEKFDPERFSEEEKSKRPQCCFLPFGEGPRLCIGMRFGLLQTKVGLISVLSDNEVHVSEKTAIPIIYDYRSFLTSAKGGIWLQIVNRRDNIAAK